jgi:hypothetical protein
LTALVSRLLSSTRCSVASKRKWLQGVKTAMIRYIT